MIELANEVKKGKEAETGLLVVKKDLILSLTKQYCKFNTVSMNREENTEFNNIHEAAKKGFIRAVVKFNFESEDRFNFDTYATWMIKLGIMRYLVRNSKRLSPPANKKIKPVSP